MPKMYVKSLKEYEGPWKFDEKEVRKAMKRIARNRKKTSVALEEKIIKDLKKVSSKTDIPDQELMRMFIIDGIERIKKAQ